ncbi:MAB_1171c family putative transporter [Micromonospora chokoriensis]|uniref:MAB_1171c family putative transporter n=1 Tax=Micromonospora chokoriensis TaxID=356851 RepID=UPI0004C45556|nr:MAB_1171c family putative transporter [Micromonospora chokoriensis]
MDTALYAFCAIAGWIALGYVVRLQRQHPSHARRAICIGLGAFAAGITVAIPPIATAIDQASGLPNLAKVLAHAGALTIYANAEIMLLHFALPPAAATARARKWIWVTACAFLVMVGLFAYTLTYDDPVLLTVEYATDPVVVAYLLIFLLLGLFAYCIDITRLCWSYAKICGRPWLRRGLRITAVGAAFALLYSTNKIGYLVAYWAGYQPAGERQIAAVLVTIAALLMTIGLTMPAWGPTLKISRRWEDYHSYRHLEPLWWDLVAAFPELELDPTLRRPLTAARDTDYALTRRVAEIRDGRLALRPYMDASVTALAKQFAEQGGLTAEDRQAVVEAAQLTCALRRHSAGLVALDPQPADELHRPEGGYAGEVAWLTLVTDAYAGSPVVAETAAATRALTAEGAP